MGNRIALSLLVLVTAQSVPIANAEEARPTKLTLEHFLDSVRAQSPELTLAKSSAQAAKAKSQGIRLMPPMFGLMQMQEGSSRANGIEVSQTLPFPTKVLQEHKVRLLEAEAKEESSLSQTASTLADARLAYVAFWSAAERLEILKTKQAWLAKHSKIARSTTRYDTESQIHYLEIESLADETENEVLAAESDVAEKRSTLKMFAPSLNLEGLVLVEPASGAVESVGESSPAIRALEKEIESKAAAEDLGKASYLPDLTLRYRLFEESEMIPRNQEIMVGVTLPVLYYWQPKAEAAQASAERQIAEAELQRARLNFELRLISLTKRESSIRAQISNLKEKLLPRSEKRLRLVRNVSQRTMEGLDQHNTVMLAHLNLRLTAVGLRLEHEQVLKELSALTGQISKADEK